MQFRRGKTRETIKYQQTITPIHLPPLGKNCELFTCYQFVLLLCNNWSLRLILDLFVATTPRQKSTRTPLVIYEMGEETVGL